MGLADLFSLKARWDAFEAERREETRKALVKIVQQARSSPEEALRADDIARLNLDAVLLAAFPAKKLGGLVKSLGASGWKLVLEFLESVDK